LQRFSKTAARKHLGLNLGRCLGAELAKFSKSHASDFGLNCFETTRSRFPLNPIIDFVANWVAQECLLSVLPKFLLGY
jgi:hypothetical protein